MIRRGVRSFLCQTSGHGFCGDDGAACVCWCHETEDEAAERFWAELVRVEMGWWPR